MSCPEGPLRLSAFAFLSEEGQHLMRFEDQKPRTVVMIRTGSEIQKYRGRLMSINNKSVLKKIH